MSVEENMLKGLTPAHWTIFSRIENLNDILSPETVGSTLCQRILVDIAIAVPVLYLKFMLISGRAIDPPEYLPTDMLRSNQSILPV